MSALWLTVAGRHLELEPGHDIVLGRDAACDVTLVAAGTSRRHARISAGPSWRLADLGSANGTRVNGTLLDGEHELADGDVIQLGSTDPGATVTVHLQTGAGTSIRIIGRASDCDVVVTDLNASRHHARIKPVATSPDTRQQWLIEDLGSFNGTFVNGRPVQSAGLCATDVVTIGSTTFEVRPDGGLDDLTSGARASLVVDGLTVTLPSGRRLLDGVSFSARPNSLTAVIGPSGAGKSTLFKSVTGALTPSGGSVTYAGLDVHTHQASLRGRIGVVPQDDVLHTQLSVIQALSYAAELRFPPDVTEGARRARVAETIGRLELTEHAQTRVDRLSGGQRKRTSVALELLTQPALLLLDEPTSGLDPGLDAALMGTLRSLAHGGRTILVITHSTDNLAICDDVLMLAPGGRVAYLGPPDGLLTHLGAGTYAEAFRVVSAGAATSAPSPGMAKARHDTAELHRATLGGSEPVEPSPVQARVRDQLGTLLRRTLRIVAADRSHLGFVAAMPVVLAALALAVPGDAGFGPASPPTSEPTQLLVVLVVGATFMGLSLSVRELVRERAIYLRERSAGLSPLAYLLSKAVVLGGVAAAQTTLMALIVLLVKPGPLDAVGVLPAPVELVVALVVTAVVAVVVGLAVSSLVSTSEQVMPLLVAAVMTQLMLCGGMIPVAGRAGLEQLALLAPARWGYAATASVVDVDRVVGPSGDRLWAHELPTFALDVSVLLVMAVFAAFVVLRRTRGPAASSMHPRTPRRVGARQQGGHP